MTLEERKNTFRKIEDLTTSRGITFYRLAKDIGISATVFSDWKSGKSMPKADKLTKIADYFDVDIQYFLE